MAGAPPIFNLTGVPRYLVERVIRDGMESFLEGKAKESTTEDGGGGLGAVWLHSYVTEDGGRAFCLYEATDPEAIRRAGRRSGLSVEVIHLVTVLDQHAYCRHSTMA